LRRATCGLALREGGLELRDLRSELRELLGQFSVVDRLRGWLGVRAGPLRNVRRVRGRVHTRGRL